MNHLLRYGALPVFASVTFSASLWGDDLPPQLFGDFASGQPELTTAPGEKRFGRASTDQYRKHPFNARKPRISLKEIVGKGSDGKPVFFAKSDVAANSLGAFNPLSGTLSVWIHAASPSSSEPLLSFRGDFMEGYFGKVQWELGWRKDGGLYVSTPFVRCEAPLKELAPGWRHVAAVWDYDHGVKIYVDGALAGSAWKSSAPKSTETFFDSSNTPAVFRSLTISRGTGENRGFAKLEEAAGWKDDRVVPQENGIRITKTSDERLQVRTRQLTRLRPGRYVLQNHVNASVDWACRISLRGEGGSQLLRGGSGPIVFEVGAEHGEAGISLDYNLQGKGEFELTGIEIKEAAATTAALKAPQVPLPSERLWIHKQNGVELRNLAVYDQPIAEPGIAALSKNGTVQTDQVEPLAPNSAIRAASLGWTAPVEAPLPKATTGKTLVFEQIPVLDAKENLRAAGWLGVSGVVYEFFPWNYHGYTQGVERELNLKLAGVPNWITGRGIDFQGTLADGKKSQPFAASAVWFNRPLEVGSPELQFLCKDGRLSQLGFYRVSTRVVRPAAKGLPLAVGSPEVLPQDELRRFRSAYPAADRTVLTPKAGTPAGKVELPAWQTWHVVTPAVEKEYALGGIHLQLRTTPYNKERRVRLVVHDPYTPWRELARVECVLEPSRTGDYSILLDLRDTILLPGTAAWVSVTSDEPVTLLTGLNGSQVALVEAESHDKAVALWKEWELRTIRDRIERISEPRPWGDVGHDGDTGWWLALSTPTYEQISRGLQRLRNRFPGDRVIEAFYAFTHPGAPTTVRDVPLPAVGNHPEWAVLARECLRQYKEFLDFWIDKRQHPNGEFGHFYGDDTDLVQDWLDYTFIADADGKVRRSLEAVATGVSSTFRLNGGRDASSPHGKPVKGMPILNNGLNVRWTDVLHAYEEGLNVQPPDFIANYGDPIRFQRLLDTAKHYDRFILTPEKDGRRYFRDEGTGMAFINDKAIKGSAHDKYWHLMLHAGLVTSWYNGDPTIWKILDAVAQTDIQRNHGGSAESLLYAGFRRTGDVAYLAPFMNVALWKEQRVVESKGLLPNILMRLKEVNRPGTLAELQKDADTRYAKHPSEKLGYSDSRHLKNWLEWQLSGDESHLVTGLRELYRDLVGLMPMRTVAEQSGDRVSIPKQLISQLYLGGVPGSRNRHFEPDFAVSYRGLGDNFAARVLENTPQAVKVELYSFEPREVQAEMGVWNLEAGEYRITVGTQESTRTLRRGDHFPITLPSNQPVVVTVTQLRKTEEPAVLADVAVSRETVQRSKEGVTVPVYNLGVAAAEKVTVSVASTDGTVLAEEVMEQVPGVHDWKLGQKAVTFRSLPQGPLRISVKTSVPEITQRNNSVELP